MGPGPRGGRSARSMESASVEKILAPGLQIEQRPDQEAAVLAAFEVVVDKPPNRAGIHEVVDPRRAVIELAAYIIDAFALEPARVRRRKPLLLPVGDFFRQVPSHRLAQEQLAVTGLAEVAVPLAAGLVLVDTDYLFEIAELHARRHPHREIDQIVVEEGDAGLQPM